MHPVVIVGNDGTVWDVVGAEDQCVALGSIISVDDEPVGSVTVSQLAYNSDIDISEETCNNCSINDFAIFVDGADVDFVSLHKFNVFNSVESFWDEESGSCHYSVIMNPATGYSGVIFDSDVDYPWMNGDIQIPILNQ